jgi:hypothetical protein
LATLEFRMKKTSLRWATTAKRFVWRRCMYQTYFEEGTRQEALFLIKWIWRSCKIEIVVNCLKWQFFCRYIQYTSESRIVRLSNGHLSDTFCVRLSDC